MNKQAKGEYSNRRDDKTKGICITAGICVCVVLRKDPSERQNAYFFFVLYTWKSMFGSASMTTKHPQRQRGLLVDVQIFYESKKMRQKHQHTTTDQPTDIGYMIWLDHKQIVND